MEYGIKNNNNRYTRHKPRAQKPSLLAGLSAKKIRIILLAFVASLLLIGTTLAVMYAITNKKTNPFTFGDTDIYIDEDFKSWTLKKVRVTNVLHENSVPGVVRVMIVPVLTDDSGNGQAADFGPLSDPGVGNKVILGDLTLELDEDWRLHWFYMDGYFYYNKVLNPGVSTAWLLNKVSLTNTSAYEKYANKNVHVEVLADIIQAESDAPAVWRVKVVGTTVSPA
ncbi:hypothetical protein LJC42_06700 [Eubacteriales bacterium OttesenSCG-928-K08]|nr:hypothetical protein [Eubacteriales bacterium OttesenSCG-928-K08]